jgi:hypothetical protein
MAIITFTEIDFQASEHRPIEINSHHIMGIRDKNIRYDPSWFGKKLSLPVTFLSCSAIHYQNREILVTMPFLLVLQLISKVNFLEYRIQGKHYEDYMRCDQEIQWYASLREKPKLTDEFVQEKMPYNHKTFPIIR